MVHTGFRSWRHTMLVLTVVGMMALTHRAPGVRAEPPASRAASPAAETVFHLQGHGVEKAQIAQANLVLRRIPEIAAELGLRPCPEQDHPYEIHLYAKYEDYAEAADRLSGGEFRKNWGFSDRASRSSHVALQPPVSANVLKAGGLLIGTRHMIAHEAAHVLRYGCQPQGTHPHWLADGFASLVEELALQRGGWIRSAEADPWFATFMSDGQKLLSGGKLPLLELLLRDESETLGFRERYAVRWLFVRFLHENKLFVPIFAGARRLGGGDTYAKRLSDVTVKLLADEHLDDVKFSDYVKKMTPQWIEVFRSLDTNGDRWLQAGFPDTNAICWRLSPRRDRLTLRGTVRILSGKNMQMNLLFGGPDGDFVSVAMVAGTGVTVFQYEAKTKTWNSVVKKDIKLLVADKDIPFELIIKDRTLRVRLGKNDTVEAKLDAAWSSGTWGLGAQAGSAGYWKGVRAAD